MNIVETVNRSLGSAVWLRNEGLITGNQFDALVQIIKDNYRAEVLAHRAALQDQIDAITFIDVPPGVSAEVEDAISIANQALADQVMLLQSERDNLREDILDGLYL